MAGSLQVQTKPNTIPSIFRRLAFQVQPHNGGRPYWADLSGFVGGDWGPQPRADGVPIRWSGDFQGRRSFAYSFAEVLVKERPPKLTFEKYGFALRTFFRFLDDIDFDQSIGGVHELRDVHGVQLRSWLTRHGLGNYTVILNVLTKMRSDPGLRPLVWQTDEGWRRTRSERTSPTVKAIVRLYRAVKKEAGQAKTRRPAGSRAAQAGSKKASGAPGQHDTALFVWIFLLKTGWNLGTVLSIDISNPDWAQDDAAKPGYVTIQGYKERAAAFQTTTSRTVPEWDPYRVVQYMLEWTKPLRAVVRGRLAKAERRSKERPSPKVDTEVARLKEVLKSPWLYRRAVKGRTDVLAFEHRDCTDLNRRVRTLARRHGLLKSHPELKEMMTSAARRTWIGEAYERSGFDIVVAKALAGHRDLSTTQRYVRTRHFRNAARERFRTVQDAVFEDLSAGKPFDATRVRLMVEQGKITEEQACRLLDIRARTRVGMGCLEPRNPPRKVAPRHRAGTLCAVQRCTGCAHGVAFEESLPYLARRLVELRLIQERLPDVSWSGSSFEAEAASTEKTLAGFDSARVLDAMNEWDGRFSRGEAHVPEIVGCPEAFEKAACPPEVERRAVP